MSQSDPPGRTSEGDHGMSLQFRSHCPIYVTQRHLSVYILPRGELMCGVQGGMTSQALGGVNLPCSWYRVRGQPPSTGGQVHTLTHMCPHNSGTERMDFLKQDACGNLVVASLLVNFPLFRLFPKVSGANVRRTECKSYLSYSLKPLN